VLQDAYRFLREKRALGIAEEPPSPWGLYPQVSNFKRVQY